MYPGVDLINIHMRPEILSVSGGHLLSGILIYVEVVFFFTTNRVFLILSLVDLLPVFILLLDHNPGGHDLQFRTLCL